MNPKKNEFQKDNYELNILSDMKKYLIGDMGKIFPLMLTDRSSDQRTGK